MHQHHQGSDASTVPAAVYPYLQGGLDRCGYECRDQECPGPTPLNQVNPSSISPLDVEAVETKLGIAFLHTWWLCEGALFHVQRRPDGDIPTYLLKLIVARNTPHGPIIPVKKKRTQLKRGAEPIQSAAVKKLNKAMEAFDDYREDPEFQAIKLKSNTQSLDDVVDWAIWFYDAYSSCCQNSGIAACKIYLLSCINVSRAGKPYPYSAWGRPDVLNRQHEWVAALAACGRMISQFERGDEKGSDAFKKYCLPDIRPQIKRQNNASVSPKSLKPLLCAAMKDAVDST